MKQAFAEPVSLVFTVSRFMTNLSANRQPDNLALLDETNKPANYRQTVVHPAAGFFDAVADRQLFPKHLIERQFVSTVC